MQKKLGLLTINKEKFEMVNQFEKAKFPHQRKYFENYSIMPFCNLFMGRPSYLKNWMLHIIDQRPQCPKGKGKGKGTN